MAASEPECACDEPNPPPEPGEAIRVLLIDDDRDDYFLTRELLDDISGSRFHLDWTADPAAGVDAICGHDHDVFLVDYYLGAKTGVELLKESKERGCSGPVILLTGRDHSRMDREALDAGADDYLVKAELTPSLLERSMRFAIAQFRAAAELERKVKERTEELDRANAALKEADRRKDIFLATLAHELRNPLSPLRNSLEIIRLAGDAGDAVRRQRERMERQVAMLVRLVEDLLDVSRFANDKLRLVVETLDLREVLDAAVDGCREAVDHAGLTLTVDVPNERLSVRGDRVRLTQVFGNLLNNAAKFTEPGGTITIDAMAIDGWIHARVIDTGIGITADAMPRLFELFSQAAKALSRSPTGLGIGLSLARNLLEMQGGTITAHSDGPGTGATFTVRLPWAE